MATYQFTANSTGSTPSVALTSTKVKVVSNAACYFAVGISPVAYNTGNCQLIPPNTVRDIIVGPGQLTYTGDTNIIGNVTTGGTGPKIAFITAAGTLAVVNVTEIGFVDFTKVTN
jgi:hypothetical protein